MSPQDLLDILKIASSLKINTRHCWMSEDRKESVADHSWRLALFAMILKDEEDFRDIDMDKVIRMCLIHDMGEAFTGDIPTFLKLQSDVEKEDEILMKWVESLPVNISQSWKELLIEMNEQITIEAKIYKALDKLEALISHNESDISTWLELEYDLQLTYGQENMKCMPYFMNLRKAVDAWTTEKISESKEKAG
ncbi:MAG: HD domain-containing protein [Erysipelotrichaceae bacterium]|nr:HD domain-containing protein [Erysipelotrichaceae bacterium]